MPADTQKPPPTPEFLAAAEAMGIVFDPTDLPRLSRYLGLLLAVNETVNLTAVRDPAQAWMKHVLDALTLMPILAELPEGASVIDVGSGGGVPGIPLAICMPGLRFVLLEATGKKADFLRHTTSLLALPNVDVVQARAELVGHDRGDRAAHAGPDLAYGADGGKVGKLGASAVRVGGHREQYDAVIARAVGPLAVVAELCVPLAKVGGLIALIKGQRAAAELDAAEGALQLLRASHLETIPTPTGRVVILEKAHPTPKAYPRRDGEPARVPLGMTASATPETGVPKVRE